MVLPKKQKLIEHSWDPGLPYGPLHLSSRSRRQNFLHRLYLSISREALSKQRYCPTQH